MTPSSLLRMMTVVVASSMLLVASGCGESQQQVGDLQMVKVHMEEKEWAQALTILDKLIETSPEDVELLLRKGKCQRELKRFAAAVTTYKKIARLDTTNFEAVVARGEIALEQAIDAQREQQPEKQIKQYLSRADRLSLDALKLKPESVRALVTHGKVLRRMGKKEKAHERFSKAAELDPECVEARLQNGNLYMNEDKFLEAENCYKAVLKIVNGHFGARLNLSKLYERINQPEKALHVLAEAEPETLKNQLTLLNRTGNLHLKAGRLEQAREQARKAEELSQGNLVSKYLRGAALLGEAEEETDAGKRKELLQEAVRHLYSATKNSKNPQWLYHHAMAIQMVGGRESEAIEAYRRLVEKGVNFPPAHYRLGYLYWKQTDYSLAKKHLTLAIDSWEKDRSPDRHEELAEAHRLRALVLDKLGEHAEARADRLEANRLTGKAITRKSGAHRALAAAKQQFDFKQFSAAIKEARRGVRLLPKEDSRAEADKRLYAHIRVVAGNAHEKLGHNTEALAAFKDAHTSNPADRGTRQRLVKAYIKTRMSDRVEPMLKQAMEDYKEDASIPTLLAQVAEMNGELADAVSYYLQALERNDHFRPAYAIATLRLSQGNAETAVKKWRELLAFRPNDVSALRGLTVALLQKGDYNSALDRAEQYTANETPSDSSTFLPPGFLPVFANARAGRWEEADKALTVATDNLTSNAAIPYYDLLDWAKGNGDNGKQCILHIMRAAVFFKSDRLIEANEPGKTLRYKRTLDELKKAQKLYPEGLLILDRLCDLYQSTNNEELLKANIARLKKKAPRYARPHHIEARMARRSRELDRMRRLLTQAVEKDDENAKWMVELSNAHLVAGQYDEALQWADNALRVNPAQNDAYTARGRALLALGDKAQARKAFEKEPDDRMASFFRTIQRSLQNKEYKSAAITARRCRIVWPTVVQFSNLQALGHEGLGDFAKAEDVLKEAMEEHPENTVAYSQLAAHYLRRRMYPKGIQTLKACASNTRSPRRPKLEIAQVRVQWAERHAREGNVQAMVEQRTQAMDIYDELLKADPDDTTVMIAKAQLLRRMSQTEDDTVAKNKLAEQALTLGTQAARKASGDKEIRATLFLAAMYRERDNIDRAITQYESIVSITPEFAPAYMGLMTLLFAQGEYSQAIATIDEAVRQASMELPESMRAVCFQLADRYDKARKALRRASNEKSHVPYLQANLAMASERFAAAVNTLKAHEAPGATDYAELVDAVKTDPKKATRLANLLSSVWFYQSHGMKNRALAAADAAVSELAGDAAKTDLEQSAIFPLTRLAELQLNAGLSEAAIKTYEKIDSLTAPGRFTVRHRLATLHMALQHYRKARHWLNQALKVLPENEPLQTRKKREAVVRTELAKVYLVTRQFDEAIALVEQIKELDADAIAPYQLEALIHQSRKQREQELRAYREIISSFPDHKGASMAYNNLASALAEQSEPELDEALRYAEKAFELARANPSVRDTFGWVKYLAGQKEDAFELLRQNEGRATNTALRCYHIGKVFLDYGRANDNPDITARGHKHLEQALKIDPDFSEADACRKALEKAGN